MFCKAIVCLFDSFVFQLKALSIESIDKNEN
jgi:hypothetical protein